MDLISLASTPRSSSIKKYAGSYTYDQEISSPHTFLGKRSIDIPQQRGQSGSEETKFSNHSFQSPRKESDRYIPSRQTINFDVCYSELTKAMNPTEDNPTNPKKINVTLDSLALKPKRLLDVFETTQQRVVLSCLDASQMMSMRSACGVPADVSLSSSSRNGSGGKRPQCSRVIPNVPSRILDAPELKDDYYLNLLHWGCNGVIAIALKQTVYLWHASDSHIDQVAVFCGENEHEDEYVASVQWSSDDMLAVGTSDNAVQVWDASTLTKIRQLPGHTARVSSLSWNGPHVISSGGRDSVIRHHDIREPGTSRGSRGIYGGAWFTGHQQEICGLSWSPDGRTLASGGNENKLCLWDAASTSSSSAGVVQTGLRNSQHVGPRATLVGHTAAVKALAWCPWERHTLASGGGTADRTIRMWNASTSASLKVTDTGSQVCALQWCNINKELVSSHGFSDNQLVLWKYPTMAKLKEFHGHTERVLHLGKSPDNQTICSASADETLRFWDILSPSSAATVGGLGGAVAKGGRGGVAGGLSSNKGMSAKVTTPILKGSMMLR